MAQNPVFEFFLFGIYSIELGKFFSDKFKNFKITANGQPTTAQVFYGTPRAAFRKAFKQKNGQIILPMINYLITDVARKPEFEPVNVYLWDKEAYDPITGKTPYMKSPAVFELTYSINLFNSSDRERDYMIHSIFTAFPKGEASLIYFPDLEHYDDVYLQMPFKIEPSLADETELEGLTQNETRDMIKTSFTMRCVRAFVPYEVKEIPTIDFIDVEGFINNIVDGQLPTSAFHQIFYRDEIKIGMKVHDCKVIIN